MIDFLDFRDTALCASDALHTRRPISVLHHVLLCLPRLGLHDIRGVARSPRSTATQRSDLDDAWPRGW